MSRLRPMRQTRPSGVRLVRTRMIGGTSSLFVRDLRYPARRASVSGTNLVQIERERCAPGANMELGDRDVRVINRLATLNEDTFNR